MAARCIWLLVTVALQLTLRICPCHAEHSAEDTPWVRWRLSSALIFDSVAHGNGVFVGVSQNGIHASFDAEEWKMVFNNTGMTSVAFGGGAFVALAFGYNTPSPVYTSRDGLVWTAAACQAVGNYSTITQLSQLAYDGNGTWVVGVKYVPNGSEFYYQGVLTNPSLATQLCGRTTKQHSSSTLCNTSLGSGSLSITTTTLMGMLCAVTLVLCAVAYRV